jgi:hypothetical protein
MKWSRCTEVCTEGHYDIGIPKVVLRKEGTAEGVHRGTDTIRIRQRSVKVGAHIRKRVADARDASCNVWRRCRLEE